MKSQKPKFNFIALRPMKFLNGRVLFKYTKFTHRGYFGLRVMLINSIFRPPFLDMPID